MGGLEEAMKWEDMTPQQRNALIAEKVMGWQPKQCDGEIGELPVSPDGWYCLECGHSGHWGDDMTHQQIPRAYSEGIGLAWQIVEKMTARMGYPKYREGQGFDEHFVWMGPLYKPADNYFSSQQHNPPHVITGHLDYTKEGGFHLGCPCWYVKLEFQGRYWWIMADTPQDAICLAALHVHGVEIERNIE